LRERLSKGARWFFGTLGVALIGGVVALLLKSGYDSVTRPDPISAKVVGAVGGRRWVIPRQPGGLPRPEPAAPGVCPARRWLRRLHAVAATGVFVVYVEGHAGSSVILDGAQAVVVHRAPPVKGTAFSCGGEGEGVPLRSLKAVVRPGGATVRYAPGADPRRPESSRTGPRDFRFALRKGDIEAFQVTATSGGCACEWKLRLSYFVDGKRGTYDVTNGGRPFATTGVGRAVSADYSGGRWHAK
jgi:hypothetical protein